MKFYEKISFNGSNIQQLSKEMSTKLASSYKNSERLIRTEVNFVNNYSAIESFKEQNIEKYQYEAVLDLRTSEICSNMDGKVFLTKEKLFDRIIAKRRAEIVNCIMKKRKCCHTDVSTFCCCFHNML